MIYYRTRSLFITFLVLSVINAVAQDRPIGFWRAHLPYNKAIGVATDGSNLFTLNPKAFYTFNGTDPYAVPVPYSKVERMSDIGMQCAAYDVSTGTAVLVYSNGNIDLFKEKENTFYNIPDFKIKSISGTKVVNDVYAENGIAYVSTSIGIMVIDLTTHNIDETYKFIQNNETIPVTGFMRNGSYFYAITGNGVYRAPTNSPQLQNFQVWTLIDTKPSYTHISSIGNRLYAATDTTVYGLINDTFRVLYSCDTNNKITNIDAGKTNLLVCRYNTRLFKGALLQIENEYVVDSYYNGIFLPLQAVQLGDSSIWIADGYGGLLKVRRDGVNVYVPDGPSDAESFDIYAHNKNVWVAHSSYTERLFKNSSFAGVSNFNSEKWKIYKQYVYEPFGTMDYFVALTKDETSGTVYMGSFINGLFTLKNDGSYEVLNTNSIFDTSRSVFGNGERQIVGLALDKSKNLWVTTVFTNHQLYVKTPEGNWYKFRIPGTEHGGPLVIDDNGQVWFVSLDGRGLYVFDPMGTISDPTDDRYYSFSTGVGAGNLPSNNVLCLARDNNDNIWVGTDNGIGIISNCNAPGPCDAQIPIVQYDQFAGYLFAGNAVRSIAVDGGNRKWVGTDDGVWLLSPDAQQIVYRFTAENSPLPSNQIRKISIDKVTGDVYIGTINGMVSFRSTATEGTKSNSNVQIFPNPVSHGYNGTIAIKGLSVNADVRITDIDGQLVYKTKAYGGQAVWDGKDYKGQKPQSGVYLVFASSSDGNETYTGKIVFMQ